MAVETRTKRFTVGEYDRMIEAGILGPDDRLELLDGDILVMNPIGSRHGRGVSRLDQAFVLAFHGRALVWSQSAIVLDDYSEPQPDIVLVRPHPDDYRDTLPSAADVLLLVEVSDTTFAYDSTRKLSAYNRAGIQEVWIVVVANETRPDHLLVYREPSPEGYRTRLTLHAGDTVIVQAFPEMTFAVSALL